MDLSNIKEFIVQEKLINKILNSPDKVYPLGTFKSSEEFPLGWTNNINKAISLARKVNAGTVWINNYGKNYSAAESAGFKQSGIGRLRGLEGLNEFTQLKNVIIETE